MGTEKPTVAFVLSLLAGIFILLGGGMTSMMGLWFGGYQGQYPYYGGMMGGYNGYGGYGWMFNMMNGYGFGMMRGFGYVFGLLGLIFGAIVIISALMLMRKPEDHSTWGTVIVIFSVLSIFGSMMAGFGIGLILGLIGGILAIAWKRSTDDNSQSFSKPN